MIEVSLIEDKAKTLDEWFIEFNTGMILPDGNPLMIQLVDHQQEIRDKNDMLMTYDRKVSSQGEEIEKLKEHNKDLLDLNGILSAQFRELDKNVRDHIKNLPKIDEKHGWDERLTHLVDRYKKWIEGLIKIVAGSENNSKTEEISSQGDIKCRKTVEGVGLDVCESGDKRVVHVLDEIRYEKEEKQK